MGFEGRERPKLSFEQAVQKGVATALGLVKERFERAATPEGNLEYHNTRHTESVIRRTKEILKAIVQANPAGRNERLVGLGELAGGWHDTVQDGEVDSIEDSSFTKKLLRRFAEKNERKSADEAVEYMRSTGGAFSEEDEQAVRQAIETTIPQFSPEVGTVVQPNLTPESGVIARAIALADIGAAGMDGPEEFSREGNAVFREDNVDIAEALQHPEAVSDAQKDFFKKRMLGWSGVQESFAAGRKARLDAELEGLSEEEKTAVKALFTKFDESIQNAHEKAARRKGMSFEDLARDFGYAV